MLQPRIEELTRNLTEYGGYWLPTHFNNEGAVGEYNGKYMCNQVILRG